VIDVFILHHADKPVVAYVTLRCDGCVSVQQTILNTVLHLDVLRHRQTTVQHSVISLHRRLLNRFLIDDILQFLTVKKFASFEVTVYVFLVTSDASRFLLEKLEV